MAHRLANRQGSLPWLRERKYAVENRVPPRRVFHIELSPLEKGRLWVEIVAFAAAGCWAFYTFSYQAWIAPSRLPAHQVLSVSVKRLASTQSGTIQQVVVNIRNDGAADVDTAAYAFNIYGASAAGLRWQSIATPNDFVLRDLKPESWSLLQASGRLFSGAVDGPRGNHILLRPGDSFDLSMVVVVPREDRLLQVHLDISYARYPILPRVPAELAHTGAGVELSGKNVPVTDIVTYFGV